VASRVVPVPSLVTIPPAERLIWLPSQLLVPFFAEHFNCRVPYLGVGGTPGNGESSPYSFFYRTLSLSPTPPSSPFFEKAQEITPLSQEEKKFTHPSGR